MGVTFVGLPLVAHDDPEQKWTEEEIGNRFGTAQQTVSDWISDIRARQKASRDSLIIRLSRLGWTLEEIAEVVGLKKSQVGEISGSTDFGKIGNLLAEGRDMAYIAWGCFWPLRGTRGSVCSRER